MLVLGRQVIMQEISNKKFWSRSLRISPSDFQGAHHKQQNTTKYYQ